MFTKSVRILFAMIIGFMAALGVGAPLDARGQEPQDLFDFSEVFARDMGQNHLAKVNFSALRVGLVNLNLFSDFTTVVDMRLGPATSPGWNSWVATPANGEVVLVSHGGVLAGTVRLGTNAYDISPDRDGLVKIERDTFDNPLEQPPLVPWDDPISTPMRTTPQDLSMTTAGPNIIGMAVFYTPAAVQAVGGIDGMNARIALEMANQNHAFTNSAINNVVYLVHSGEVEFSEDNFDWYKTMGYIVNSSDNIMDEIPRSGPEYGADNKVLLVDGGNAGYCGLGMVMNDGFVGPKMGQFAYAIVSAACNSAYHAFQHENGHTWGACHEVTDPCVGAYPYAHSYASLLQRTLLSVGPVGDGSYPPSLLCYSNPNILCSGEILGVSEVTDNARVLNNTGPIAAAWQPTVVPVITTITGRVIISGTGVTGATVYSPWSSTQTQEGGQYNLSTVAGQQTLQAIKNTTGDLWCSGETQVDAIIGQTTIAPDIFLETCLVLDKKIYLPLVVK